MKAVKKLLTCIFLIATTVTLLSFDLPKDWFKAGSHPKSYDMGIDKGAGQNGKNAGTIKSIDKMHDGEKDRSIKGTTDWTEYEIVLDVPLNATKLAYGVLLVGTGQVWFDNIKFEVVDNSVPTTNIDMESLMEDN